MMVAIMADNPDRRRVATAAKKSIAVHVRLTVLEARRLKVAAARHDPPTVAAVLRSLIAERFDRPRSRPAT